MALSKGITWRVQLRLNMGTGAMAVAWGTLPAFHGDREDPNQAPQGPNSKLAPTTHLLSSPAPKFLNGHTTPRQGKHG